MPKFDYKQEINPNACEVNPCIWIIRDENNINIAICQKEGDALIITNMLNRASSEDFKDTNIIDLLRKTVLLLRTSVALMQKADRIKDEQDKLYSEVKNQIELIRDTVG